jgi:hypothetical protein
VRITFYYLRSVVRPPVVVLAFLFESSAGPILRTCSACPPFRRVPRPVHRAVGLPSKHLPAAPAACQVGSALVILIVLSAGPFPIALTISYGNSSSHPLWPAQRGLSELSGQPLTLGVFRFCQIYRDITSPPSQIPSPRPSGSPVLPKSLMLTLL